MRKLFQDFRKSESGATLVEYGVALILAIVLGAGALTALSQSVADQMDQGSDTMIGEGSVTGNGDNS